MKIYSKNQYEWELGWSWSLFNVIKPSDILEIIRASLDLSFDLNVSVPSGCTINQRLSKPNYQYFPQQKFVLSWTWCSCAVYNNAWSTTDVAFWEKTVWKILSINIIFHGTLKINSRLCCLYLKIYIFGQYCAAMLSTHNLPGGYQYEKNVPITNQVYCKQTTALIGYTVTSFPRRLLQFLKAELRSIIDVNH